jgi:hypothetical protein
MFIPVLPKGASSFPFIVTVQLYPIYPSTEHEMAYEPSAPYPFGPASNATISTAFADAIMPEINAKAINSNRVWILLLAAVRQQRAVCDFSQLIIRSEMLLLRACQRT